MTRDEYWLKYCEDMYQNDSVYRNMVKPVIDNMVKQMQEEFDKEILRIISNGK